MISANLLDFDLDFGDNSSLVTFCFGDISVLGTFQFWYYFSLDDISVLVTFPFFFHSSFMICQF